MNYGIKRGDQEFGPYSLTEIQQHVQTGHISAEDLAQSEGMSEWFPVSQVLGDIPIPPTPQPGVYPGSDPNAGLVQPIGALPPNLPWQVLLVNYLYRVPVFGFLVSIFVIVWSLIQAN